MKFIDLQFNTHPSKDGVRAAHFFDNGYGVSIIQTSFSYGGSQGLYEVAILKGNDTKWNICYDTHISDDVLGYCGENDVNIILEQVSSLSS